MDGVNGWMTCNFSSFSTVFQSEKVIILGDNDRLCAMEPLECKTRVHLATNSVYANTHDRLAYYIPFDSICQMEPMEGL